MWARVNATYCLRGLAGILVVGGILKYLPVIKVIGKCITLSLHVLKVGDGIVWLVVGILE